MINDKPSICFVLPSLSAGGAERVVSFIAQQIDKNKFHSTLLIIGKKIDTVYNVSDIDLIYFEKNRVLNGIPDLIKYFRTNKPQIVLSAVGHLNTIIAYISVLFPKIKFIAREVNVLTVQQNFYKKKFIDFSFITKNRFRFFDKIVCQSKDMYEDILLNFNSNKEKLIIINNPITKDFQFNSHYKASKIAKFITVASLKKQKGHLRIIQALKKFKFPFHYTILGDGSEKENIMELINNLGLSDSITHVPYASNVRDYLSESDVFLQGSYVEGFPNSLIESCAVGTPVVAYNAPGGLDEIIINGINGYITNNEKEYVNSIHKIVIDNSLKRELVSQSVFKKFAPEIITKKYESLFRSLLEDNSN